jgi:hypothetical protein
MIAMDPFFDLLQDEEYIVETINRFLADGCGTTKPGKAWRIDLSSGYARTGISQSGEFAASIS